MKKLFLGLILSALLGLPVLAALKVADKATDFSARASSAHHFPPVAEPALNCCIISIKRD